MYKLNDTAWFTDEHQNRQPVTIIGVRKVTPFEHDQRLAFKARRDHYDGSPNLNGASDWWSPDDDGTYWMVESWFRNRFALGR